MRASNPRRCQRGFTFLWVLFVIAVLGIGLTAVSEVAVTTAKRQHLAELDWMGAQFVQAIGSYYYAAPTGAMAYPRRMEDLLEDPRYTTVRRHLRVMYRNPFTGRVDWEVLPSSDGGIRGIRARIPNESGAEVKDFMFQP